MIKQEFTEKDLENLKKNIETLTEVIELGFKALKMNAEVRTNILDLLRINSRLKVCFVIHIFDASIEHVLRLENLGLTAKYSIESIDAEAFKPIAIRIVKYAALSYIELKTSSL